MFPKQPFGTHHGNRRQPLYRADKYDMCSYVPINIIKNK